MNVNFNGYAENAATFIADTALTETGVPVKMSADGTVTQCAAGDVFCGICIDLRDGYATVQLSGYTKVSTGSKLGVGYKKLAAAASGKVAASESGREYLVIDSTATESGIIL